MVDEQILNKKVSMEVIWSRKKATKEWCKFMREMVKHRKKSLQENKKTMKQKVNNPNEKLIVKLLYEETIHELPIKSFFNIKSSFINLNDIIREDEESILIRIDHSDITTTINLTNISPYVVLCFDETLNFKGASYSIKRNSGAYAIQTQYKTLLFIKHPNNIKFNELKRIRIADI